MNRLSLILATLALGTMATTSDAAVLRSMEVHVTSDIVTLGDLFDGAADHANLEVAKAPPPGKTTMIDAGTLYSLSVSNHLDWHPLSMAQKIIIMRDGDSVTGTPAAPAGTTLNAVISPLLPTLAEQGAGEKLAVLLDGGEQQRLLTSLPAGSALAVDQLVFDAPTRHFTATLADVGTGQRYAVAGKAIALLQIPVPAHRLMQGDVINASDITWIEQRADQLRSDTVETSESMIGKVTKRPLEANLPVQGRFLGMPAVVKNGDRVTMIVKNNGIILTAEGRALGDAGVGETVRLANAASNKTLEGTVTGPGMAEVRTDSAIVAAANTATIVR